MTNTYKKTNIDWMEKIPSDWGEISLRGIFEDVKEQNTDGRITNSLSLMKDVGIIPYEDKGNVGNKKSDKIEKYKIVSKGDFVINKMNAVIGSLGVSRYEGLVSPVYFVLRINDKSKYLMKYFEYIFQTREVQKYFRTMASGIMEIREALDWHKFKNMQLPLPNIETQKKIVGDLEELDIKLATFIKKKENYIKLIKEHRQSEINELITKGLNPNVKMIDSGIEWLGKIPEHWETNKIKNLFFINRESLSENEDPELVIKYLDIGNLNSNGEIIGLQEMSYKNAPSRARRIVNKKDIVLSTVRTYLRSIGYLSNPDSNLIVSTGYAVLSLKKADYVAEYFYYLLRSTYFIERVVVESVGVSYPGINSTKLTSLKIAFPPNPEEQQKILSACRKISNKAEDVIQKAISQIEIIKTYRKSLIYEAVTGSKTIN